MTPDPHLIYRTHGYRVEVLHHIGHCQLTRAYHTLAEDIYIATWGTYKVTAKSAGLALAELREWRRIERLYGQFWPCENGQWPTE